MGRVGAAGDITAMESFFALLQKNVLDRRTWDTREDLRIGIVTGSEGPTTAVARLAGVDDGIALVLQDGHVPVSPVFFQTYAVCFQWRSLLELVPFPVCSLTLLSGLSVNVASLKTACHGVYVLNGWWAAVICHPTAARGRFRSRGHFSGR
jgi:hypothetical protein